jgi:hypothetical protein
MNASPTFSLKQLRFTFTLSNNAVFAGTNSNVLQVSGLRASATIKGSGFPAFPEADLAVYGLKQSDMNALTSTNPFALSTLANGTPMLKNSVLVEANSGNGQGWSSVFAGQIITAGPDYDAAPAVPMKLFGRVLGFESLSPANATSYTGPTSVAEIVSNIAARMGYVFENNGVAAQLNSPYFSGTLTEQLRTVAQHAGIEVYVSPETNIVAICPYGVPRATPAPFVLSPSSGLVGYPTFDYTRGYVRAKSLYNPALRFGGTVTVKGTEVPGANGNWVIGTISHRLESLMPNGAWFSELLLYPSGQIPPSS